MIAITAITGTPDASDVFLLVFFIGFLIFAAWFITYKIRGGYKWRKKQIRIAGSQLTVSYDDLLKQGFKASYVIRDATIMAKDYEAYIIIDFSDEEEKWCKIDDFVEGKK